MPSLAALELQGASLTAEQYLDLAAGYSPQSAVLGMKILVHHFDQRADIGLWETLLRRRMRVIHLVRDPIQAALSAAIARERGLYNIPRNSAIKPELLAMQRPVRVAADWLYDEVRYYRHSAALWHERLCESGLDFITVSYEAWLSDRQKCLNETFAFLGQPPVAVVQESQFERVTSADVLDDITNRDEIAELLSAIAWQDQPERQVA